jgi:hypothetical protein
VANDGPRREQLLTERIGVVVEPPLDDEMVVLEVWEVFD